MSDLTVFLPKDKLVYNLQEVMGLVGVSRATVYKEIEARRLKKSKIGTRTVFLVPDIIEWLEKYRGAY